jgi:glucose/arabinose dehydrogenase
MRALGLATAAVALVLAATALSGCQLVGGGGEPQVTSGTTQTPGVTPTPSVEPSAPTGAVSLAKLQISLTKVADGFSSPLYATNAGDDSGRLFVVEQTGKVRVVTDGKVAPGAFLDVSRLISTGGERGLLGLAFDPEYEINGRFYVNYTDRVGSTVVARYVASPPSSNTPKLAGPTKLLTIEQPYSNHNGGCIEFGPDGMLYVGMGDGGSAGDPEKRAQNLSQPLGKMLRLDVSGSKSAVPKDNPYAGQGYPQDLIWARGLRNPWRFSFDSETGDLWIGDVGQGEWEEIDLARSTEPGLNYGWSTWEGNHPFPPDSAAPPRAGYTFPIVEYPHPTGESVTGGYVYRGSEYPAMVGTYFYADYVKGWIAGIQKQAPDQYGLYTKPQTQRLLDTDLNISSFGVDQRQELYVTDLQGGLYRVEGRAK